MKPSEVHTFSLVTRDKPGVLVRIALVFARRGYNIESLAVSPGARAGFARMSIASSGDPQTREQIIKQLNKLIDVVYVTGHEGERSVEVEIALLKLRLPPNEREPIMDLVQSYGGRVVDYGAETLIVCVDGTSDKVQDLMDKLNGVRVEELVRSGKVVMDPGASHFSHLLAPD